MKNLKLYVEPIANNLNKSIMEQFPVVTVVIIFLSVLILASAIRILREYERGVIFRLGRLIGGGGIKGPGLDLADTRY